MVYGYGSPSTPKESPWKLPAKSRLILFTLALEFLSHMHENVVITV